MPRYRSRLGKSVASVAKAKKPRAKPARAKAKPISAAVEPVEELLPEIKDNAPAPLEEGIGGAVSTGGALRTGGAVATGGRVDVDSLSYPDVIHMLGHMDGQDYHMLQGIASLFMPQVHHPLKMPYKELLGGAIHPADISKVATMDVLLAPNSRKLSSMLHTEWLDQRAGRDVGGGLFSSIKNILKKGVSGLAKVAKGAVNIGKRVVGVINKGKGIAKAIQVPLGIIAPGAADLLGRGIQGAEALQRGIGLGLPLGQAVASGLGEVAEAVN